MASIVDICNMALMRFGHSATISDINEVGNAATVLRLFYPLCRDQVLQGANWNFATKRVSLALLSGTETNWEYAYAYPSDAVAVRYLITLGQRAIDRDHAAQFEVATMDGARVILSDMPQAEAVYTLRVEDPNLFSPLFISALVDLIASKAAMPISGKPELGRDALQTYFMAMSQAQVANLNEAEQGPPPECEFLTVRR